MIASLFSTTDSSDPTSALPTLESLSPASDESDTESSKSYNSRSDYVAPLSGHVPDPSIDGTSVSSGGEAGIRAEKLEDVGADDKAVSTTIQPVSSHRGALGGGTGHGI